MKPSTHKKIKKFKKNLEKSWYTLMYPLAWTIDKYENIRNKRLKKKLTMEKIAKVLAKEIYKKLAKSSGHYHTSVIIADNIDTNYCTDANSFIDYYSHFNSKGRKLMRLKGIYREHKNELFELVMCELNRNYKYVEVKKEIEEENLKPTWKFKNYKCTYNIKLLED